MKLTAFFFLASSLSLVSYNSHSSSPAFGEPSVSLGIVNTDSDTGYSIGGELFTRVNKNNRFGLGVGIEAQIIDGIKPFNAYLGAVYNISPNGNNVHIKLRGGTGSKGALIDGTLVYTFSSKNVNKYNIYIGYQKYNNSHNYLSGVKAGVGYYF